MNWWMEISQDAPAPKRGDLIQTAMGTRRQRTWMILRSVRKKKSKHRRFSIWKARWWELESEFRLKLYLSATRNGGQITWYTRPLRKKKVRHPL